MLTLTGQLIGSKRVVSKKVVLCMNNTRVSIANVAKQWMHARPCAAAGRGLWEKCTLRRSRYTSEVVTLILINRCFLSKGCCFHVLLAIYHAQSL